MKLLDRYEAACRVRRPAVRAIQTYRRWVEEFLRFHHERTGRCIHPQEMGEADVEAFLTHLAVNRRVAESRRIRRSGRSFSSTAMFWRWTWVLSMRFGPTARSACQPCFSRKKSDDRSRPCPRREPHRLIVELLYGTELKGDSHQIDKAGISW